MFKTVFLWFFLVNLTPVEHEQMDSIITGIRAATGTTFHKELTLIDPPPMVYMNKRKWFHKFSPGVTTFSDKLIAVNWIFFRAQVNEQAETLLHESAHVYDYKRLGKFCVWGRWLFSARQRLAFEIAGVQKEMEWQKAALPYPPALLPGWVILRARKMKQFYNLDSIPEKEIRHRLELMRNAIFANDERLTK